MEPDAARPRRPLGVSILALFYVVLGAHALMFGLYLANLTPELAPAALFIQVPEGLVRGYGLALLGVSAAFFANGVALFRGWRHARWSTVGLVPLHIVGPPFLLGGVLFALAANLYLFGSQGARGYFQGLAGSPVSQGS